MGVVKPKTKAITLANQSRRKQHNEPIRPVEAKTCKWSELSARKRVRASHHLFKIV